MGNGWMNRDSTETVIRSGAWWNECVLGWLKLVEWFVREMNTIPLLKDTA